MCIVDLNGLIKNTRYPYILSYIDIVEAKEIYIRLFCPLTIIYIYNIIHCSKHSFIRGFISLIVQFYIFNTVYLFQKITAANLNELLITFVLARGVHYNSSCQVP